MDPKAFKIIDGKLYLNWDKEFAIAFAEKAEDNIKKADANWDRITRNP